MNMNFSLWVAGSRRELTPWSGGADKPTQVGTYQRNFPAGPYSRWDGVQWLQDAAAVAPATDQTRASAYQNASWRGLAESSQPRDAPDSTRGTDTRHVDVPFDDAP